MPGCGFPRLKGRTNSSLFFLIDNLVAFIIDRCGVRSTIIPEQLAGTWFSLAVFVLSQSGFFLYLICRTTADQACFCT
jgi:hypothetical protein